MLKHEISQKRRVNLIINPEVFKNNDTHCDLFIVNLLISYRFHLLKTNQIMPF